MLCGAYRFCSRRKYLRSHNSMWWMCVQTILIHRNRQTDMHIVWACDSGVQRSLHLLLPRYGLSAAIRTSTSPNPPLFISTPHQMGTVPRRQVKLDHCTWSACPADVGQTAIGQHEFPNGEQFLQETWSGYERGDHYTKQGVMSRQTCLLQVRL